MVLPYVFFKINYNFKSSMNQYIKILISWGLLLATLVSTYNFYFNNPFQWRKRVDPFFVIKRCALSRSYEVVRVSHGYRRRTQFLIIQFWMFTNFLVYFGIVLTNFNYILGISTYIYYTINGKITIKSTRQKIENQRIIKN